MSDNSKAQNSASKYSPQNIFAKSKAIFPGFLVAATIALASTFIAERYGGPVMLFALLLGMAFNFLSDSGSKTEVGVQFTSKSLLRLAVGLLGAQITITQIMQLGLLPVILVISAVFLTIAFGVIVAKWFGLSRNFGLLTAGSVAICGASAAMAISTVLPQDKDHERNTLFTVIAVTTLSTIAMIAYPVFIGLFDFSDSEIGIFLGGTIHDVAQVVGAGYSVSEEAGNVSTFTKLLRVTMLLPVVFGLSLYFAKKAGKGEKSGGAKGTFPSFLLLFIALVIINSIGFVPEQIMDFIKVTSRWLLVTAIAALGIKTSLKKMAAVGGAAIGLIVAETIFLALLVLGVLLIGI